MPAALQRLSELRRADSLPIGVPAIERLLPDGLRAGSLVEWLAERGSGAGTLAFQLAAPHPCIVIDRERAFHPPAVGLSPVVVHPPNEREMLWALEQSLRYPVAVIARIDRLNSSEFHRLKLAARHGGGLGLLLRPPDGPAWADVRFRVTPLARRDRQRQLRIEVYPSRRTALLELNDETGAVRLVPRPIVATAERARA
ncbi:MAG: hypothetical protein JNG89_12625 [Planctomycetaceae bacterium]|nr:hypothetical protein [Planctomycetaceae bacterium]